MLYDACDRCNQKSSGGGAYAEHHDESTAVEMPVRGGLAGIETTSGKFVGVESAATAAGRSASRADEQTAVVVSQPAALPAKPKPAPAPEPEFSRPDAAKYRRDDFDKLNQIQPVGFLQSSGSD